MAGLCLLPRDTSALSAYRYGGAGGVRLCRRDRTTISNIHPVVSGFPTNINGDLTHFVVQQPTPLQPLPSAYGQQCTDTPHSYMHEYEREIARWQARRNSRRERRPLTCSVCLEVMDPSVWIQPTPLCVHEPRICEPCLVQYVRHAIREEGLTEVVCPDPGCRHQLEEVNVVKYIQEDPVCLCRYNALVAQRELEKQPNFVWCQNPRCGQGQIHDEGDASPLVICQYCHKSSCFTHRVPWHNGVTCEQYTVALRRGQVRANEKYIGKHTKRCPNPRCRRPIEKVSGCDRMTCYRPGGCGHEFCWACLTDYGPTGTRQQRNHQHNPDCRYYARNPNVSGLRGVPRRLRLTIQGVGRALTQRSRLHTQPAIDPPRPARVRPRARSTRRLVVLNFLFGRS